MSGLGRARRALSVTLAQVQGALAGDQVLVELLRYGHYMGKNKWEDRYGALVIAPKGEPKWIPLGAAAAIEEKVKLYGKSVRRETDESMLHLVLRTLHDRVWAPIEKTLPVGGKVIILSPERRTQFHFLCNTPDPYRRVSDRKIFDSLRGQRARFTAGARSI